MLYLFYLKRKTHNHDRKLGTNFTKIFAFRVSRIYQNLENHLFMPYKELLKNSAKFQVN